MRVSRSGFVAAVGLLAGSAALSLCMGAQGCKLLVADANLELVQEWGVRQLGKAMRMRTRAGIEKDVVNPDDVDMLQDLIVAAVNEGVRKAQEMASAEMAKVTGGMKLPGMM